MQRQLYVTTKKYNDGARLIGILSENNGRYSFEYKLGGKFHEWFLKLKEFPDATRKYEGVEVEDFINKFIPSKNHMFYKELMESANLVTHDTWEILKAFGSRVAGLEYAFLHEELPEGAVVYEN